MDALKLNIGSRVKAAGWKTFDIDPGPEVDYVGDCRDLSRFADNSVDTIYASHVLEHVPYQGVLQATLNEWFRALVPGGTVMISVPDLETLCRLFLEPELTYEQRFHIMRVIFGGQIDTFDFHYAGLTFEFLTAYLAAAGFEGIRRVETFDLFQDASLLKVGDRAISLNVIARKPKSGPRITTGAGLVITQSPGSFMRRGG